MTDADIRDRIATIASEAFGPFPVQTVEEDLTAIEQGISKLYEDGAGDNTALRSLSGELLESLRLAERTSDGHRDAHAAFQRWAAVHAPDAIGDEQKREAIDGLLRARPLLDPAHRETFERMLRHEQDAARRLRAQSGDPECPAIDDEIEARIEALTAVLGGTP